MRTDLQSDPPQTGEALALRDPAAPGSAMDDVRLQKLWLATQRRPWSSLAVVPANRSTDTLPVAEMLARIAWWYRGQPSCVFDLRDVSLRLVEYQIAEVQAQIEGGSRVFIALRSIFDNPTAVPIGRQADAIILCTVLGRTDLRAAQKTIDQLGRDRVLGSIVLRTDPVAKQVRIDGL
jgi:hypothetical protein